VQVISSGLTVSRTVLTADIYDATLSYDLRVTVADKLNSVVGSLQIPTAFMPLVLGQKGIGINKFPEYPGLDLAGEVWYNGTKIELDTLADQIDANTVNIGLLNGCNIQRVWAGVATSIPPNKLLIVYWRHPPTGQTYFGVGNSGSASISLEEMLNTGIIIKLNGLIVDATNSDGTTANLTGILISI